MVSGSNTKLGTPHSWLQIGLLRQFSWNAAAALSTSCLYFLLDFIFLITIPLDFCLLIRTHHRLGNHQQVLRTTNLKTLFQKGQCFLHLSTITMEISPGADWLLLHCTLCIAQQPLEIGEELLNHSVSLKLTPISSERNEEGLVWVLTSSVTILATVAPTPNPLTWRNHKTWSEWHHHARPVDLWTFSFSQEHPWSARDSDQQSFSRLRSKC